jgi:hypothetical protein
MGIKSDIRESSDYKRFKKIVQQVQARLNIEKDTEEALALHAGRTSRKLYGDKRYSPKSLLDASSNDMGARSRLVEIRVRYSKQIDVLHEACKAMKHSMLTNFADSISAKFKTVGARNSFTETMIASALEVQHEGDALIKLLDTLIEDIDKTGYHLSNMTDILKLLENSKGGTVI